MICRFKTYTLTFVYFISALTMCYASEDVILNTFPQPDGTRLYEDTQYFATNCFNHRGAVYYQDGNQWQAYPFYRQTTDELISVCEGESIALVYPLQGHFDPYISINDVLYTSTSLDEFPIQKVYMDYVYKEQQKLENILGLYIPSITDKMNNTVIKIGVPNGEGKANNNERVYRLKVLPKATRYVSKNEIKNGVQFINSVSLIPHQHSDPTDIEYPMEAMIDCNSGNSCWFYKKYPHDKEVYPFAVIRPIN